MRALLPIPLLVAVSACTTPATAPQDIRYSESDRDRKLVCDAGPVQGFVGEMIAGETGEQILRQSGSAMLRWGPPDSLWTGDFRLDRVNVRYDRAMTITEITCG